MRISLTDDVIEELQRNDPGVRTGKLHSPIGLDVGARDPEEIAVSIIAEILAVLRGRNGGRGRLSVRRTREVAGAQWFTLRRASKHPCRHVAGAQARRPGQRGRPRAVLGRI